MRIKMLRDAPGSPDGIIVKEYALGETYDVSEGLGAALVADGAAEIDAKAATPVEPDPTPMVEAPAPVVVPEPEPAPAEPVVEVAPEVVPTDSAAPTETK